MAAGDLITLPYQFEYNGLLMGNGTNYDLTSITGLEFMSVREGDDKRPLDHGNIDTTPDLMPNRVVIVRGEVISSDLSLVTAMRNATGVREANQAQLLPLVVQLYDGLKYRINCRVRRRDVPVDQEFSWGFPTFTLMFWAPDPRIYSNGESNNTATAGFTGGTGFGFDIAFDLSFGGGSGGAGIAYCLNSGDMNTAPVVTLHGPLTAPRLINDSTGEEWSTTMTLASGDDLVVDMGNRTVTLFGATRYSTVTSGSVWWTLRPGGNSVRLSAPTGTGTATITWRSAWHAVI